jgi:hypothetical protein
MVHEVARAEELAERQLRARVIAPITPGSRSKSTAQGTCLPPKVSRFNVDAVELRINFAVILAAAADAVFVAHRDDKNLAKVQL